MTQCPTCHQKTIRTTTLVEGATIFACRGCGRFLVEGAAEWIEAGPNLRERLIALAASVKVQNEIMTTPIEDPRWTEIYLG